MTAEPVVRTITLGSKTLRTSVRHGDGTKTPLLLINGIGASLELFDPFIAVLDPGRTVIRFDAPGVGGSPLPGRPYHFTTLAPLIARMLDRLGFDQVDVLGISWGGGVAQQFAVQRFARVRRVVLVATGTGVAMVPARPSVLAKMLTPRRYRDQAYAQRIAGDIYGGTMRTHPSRGAAVLHSHSRVGPRRGYYYQLAAGAYWTSLPILPILRQRTLVLAGDDDPIIPLVNARIMNKLLPRGRLHVYHGGHLALLTEAAQMGPIIERFLDGDR